MVVKKLRDESTDPSVIFLEATDVSFTILVDNFSCRAPWRSLNRKTAVWIQNLCTSELDLLLLQLEG